MEKFSRNEQQEIVMSIIYSALTYASAGVTFSVEELIEDNTGLPYEEVPFFIKELTIKTLNHEEEIIKAIEPKLNKWQFHRLNRVDQAVLLMSYAHYYYIGNVSKSIVINIAVKMVKKFVLNDDYKYVNAVLDEVLV